MASLTLVLHEVELKGRIGVSHNVASEEEVATAARGEIDGIIFQQNVEDPVAEVGDRIVIAYTDEPTMRKTLILTREQKDDPVMGVIFVGRPIGQALLGRAEEDVVNLPAGGAVREATILKIEKRAGSQVVP